MWRRIRNLWRLGGLNPSESFQVDAEGNYVASAQDPDSMAKIISIRDDIKETIGNGEDNPVG